MAEQTKDRPPADSRTDPASNTNTGRFAPDGKTMINARGMPVDEATPAGPHGMALVNPERGGAIVEDELRPDPPDASTLNPLRFQARYVRSKLRKEAGDIIARAPENIGLFGKGDTYHGTGILIDIDSMQGIRVYDGYRFEDDRVFANSRDLPAALVDEASITDALK
jgi:hypothetical protein